MTSKLYSVVLAGTAVLAVTLGATGANAATASSPARARILSALTLTNTRGLDFGAIVASATADDVVISPAGTRTCGTNITCSGTVSSASFNVTTGTATEFVTIDAVPTVSLSNGTVTMTADLLESSATVQLDAAGAASFTVGGTLHVGVNQAQGTYTGNFNVTANYQ
jgi:hypothetical protein